MLMELAPLLLTITWVAEASSAHPPNIVMLLADDLGIGDLGCYGNHTINTPNIDSLSFDGVKLTHHLAAASMCTPSRAAILTGRYPARFGFVGGDAGPNVQFRVSGGTVLPHSEVTLAEALQEANYTTAFVGKWHLGSECELLGRYCGGPLNHGFHYFYGLPFTLLNEMAFPARFWIFDPHDKFYQVWMVAFSLWVFSIGSHFWRKSWRGLVFISTFGCVTLSISWFYYTHFRFHTSKYYGSSAWVTQTFDAVTIENGYIVKQWLDKERGVCQPFLEKSIEFIDRSMTAQKPFFLLHSFLHVHTPLITHPSNMNKSKHGSYGDNVEEMDGGVGFILEALEKRNLTQNTIVYFTSDHGAHLEVLTADGLQRAGGHNKNFKGGKGQGGQEGGIRVPGLLKWPQHIQPTTTLDVPFSHLDLLPTFLDLISVKPVDKLFNQPIELDGISMKKSLLEGERSVQRRVLLHHCRSYIHSMRLVKGDDVYKLHFFWPKWTEGSVQCGTGDNYCSCFPADNIDLREMPRIFHLNTDPYEDAPIDTQSHLYKSVRWDLEGYLEEWRRNVSYSASILGDWRNQIWIPWRQPFCLSSSCY